MANAVQHFVSMEPDVHVITRARVIPGKRTDEVALFAGDRLIGRLEVDAGTAAELCTQMHLVNKLHVVSLADIQRQFARALTEE